MGSRNSKLIMKSPTRNNTDFSRLLYIHPKPALFLESVGPPVGPTVNLSGGQGASRSGLHFRELPAGAWFRAWGFGVKGLGFRG